MDRPGETKEPAMTIQAEDMRLGQGEAVMTVAQEMLFVQLAQTYWEDEQKKVKVHLDNLVFVAQVKAVQKGWM